MSLAESESEAANWDSDDSESDEYDARVSEVFFCFIHSRFSQQQNNFDFLAIALCAFTLETASYVKPRRIVY